MNVLTPAQPGGWKSMPAEFKAGPLGASRLRRHGDAFRGIRGLGYTADEIVDMIRAGGESTLELIVAQNPGTQLVRKPDGTLMIYNQPTGTTANLPGIYGTGGYVAPQPGGSVTTPGGGTASFSFGDLDGTTVALIAVVGFLGIMALKK